MIRLVLGFCLLLLVSAACPGPAKASMDFWCEPSWQLVHRDRTDCDNMAMLAPGNDTRVNLMLLMQDLKQVSLPSDGKDVDPLVDWPTFAAQFVPPPAEGQEATTDYAEGEGSRCRSDASGTMDFAAAITADAGVPEAERAVLIAARKSLAPSCTGPSGGAAAVDQAVQQAQSAGGKSFAAYLKGAQAFYDGDYEAAKASFSSLTGDAQPWLSETARYMLGRVEVNRAQVDAFDEYGYQKESSAIDPKVIDAADAALQDYLSAFPKGRYAASARGLLRRVYWLGGRNDKLAERYVALLAEDASARGLNDVDFSDEIDNKLLAKLTAAETKDPNLLAVLDLAAMRQDNGLARADLEAQKDAFTTNPTLFEYLLAAYAFYVEHKPEEVLKAIPMAEALQKYTTLAFSRQMLRGMAMEATQDPKARDYWTGMIAVVNQPMEHAALELALAYHDERNNGVARVFAADSPVKNVTLRQVLLTNIADANLLRQQATDAAVPQLERDNALHTLLYKELSRGRYADFVQDVALVPADAPKESAFSDVDGRLTQLPLGLFTATDSHGEYDCGPLKETASQLAKNPKLAKAQLCLADFFLVNGFDQNALDTQPPAEQLGGTPSLFGGKVYSRQAVYQALIANAKTPAADKAYALYRAVNCYAPSGNNSCGGKDVPVAQRKAWFNTLKREYPKSTWAKELQYYW